MTSTDTVTSCRIPRTDIDALPISLGGNVFGWTADEATSFAILDAFVGGGGSMVDTADMYSGWVPGNRGGDSERIIGAWLARGGRREDLVIATKVAKYAQRPGLAPANVAAAAEDSLVRMGIETIDLYYAHQDDASVPVDEIVAGFDALVQAGTVRHWALSNFSAARTDEVLRVAAAAGMAGPVAVQPHYNLVHRDAYEAELAPVLERHGISALPYYGLASGFLTGKYDRDTAQERAAESSRGGGVSTYFTDAGFALVDELRAIAVELDTEPASVALAWLAAQPTVSSPIASASRPDQVPGLLDAARIELTPDHLRRLDATSAAM